MLIIKGDLPRGFETVYLGLNHSCSAGTSFAVFPDYTELLLEYLEQCRVSDDTFEVVIKKVAGPEGT